jgi:hypothetical protein
LLRPRAVAPPHLAPADVEPNVFAAGDVSGGITVAPPAVPAWAAEQAEAEPEPQWWERDEVVSPPAVSAPAIPALDEDLHTPEAGAIDFSQAEMADEDDEDDDEPDAAAHFDIPPVQADDGMTAPVPVVPSLPPLEPPLPPPGLSDTSSWSPEVPAGRPDGIEPDTGTIVPERKRRFFGGRDKS